MFLIVLAVAFVVLFGIVKLMPVAVPVHANRPKLAK